MKVGRAVVLAMLPVVAGADAWATQPEALSDVGASLRVAGPASCPDEASLRRIVEEILERPLAGDGTERVGVDVGFRADGVNGWEARIRMTEEGRPAGERILHDRGVACSALAGPTGLVIALMVEAHRPKARLHAPPQPEPTVKAMVMSAPEIAEPVRWGMGAVADVRGSWGALPGAALGFSLGADVTPPGAFPVRLSMTLWPAKETTDGGRGGRFQLWYAGVEVCHGWTSEEAHVTVCSGVHAGQLEGAGVGLAQVREPRHPWVHLSTVLDAGVRLGGPFGLHASVGAAVPFHRPTFVYGMADGTEDEVHRSAPVVPIIGIGLEAVVPP